MGKYGWHGDINERGFDPDIASVEARFKGSNKKPPSKERGDMTTVIHIKNAPSGWKTNDQFVYIGRPSKWGNPYDVSMGRTKCISLFQDYVTSGMRLMGALHELKGKTLVCFCKPQACHGDILVALADAS